MTGLTAASTPRRGLGSHAGPRAPFCLAGPGQPCPQTVSGLLEPARGLSPRIRAVTRHDTLLRPARGVGAPQGHRTRLHVLRWDQVGTRLRVPCSDAQTTWSSLSKGHA